jgi:hypothetical protein
VFGPGGGPGAIRRRAKSDLRLMPKHAIVIAKINLTNFNDMTSVPVDAYTDTRLDFLREAMMICGAFDNILAQG